MQCKTCAVEPSLGRKIHKKAGVGGSCLQARQALKCRGGREAGSKSNDWTWDWILNHFLKEATPTQNPMGEIGVSREHCKRQYFKQRKSSIQRLWGWDKGWHNLGTISSIWLERRGGENRQRSWER